VSSLKEREPVKGFVTVAGLDLGFLRGGGGATRRRRVKVERPETQPRTNDLDVVGDDGAMLLGEEAQGLLVWV
jgi:hypothetical protein